MKNYETASKYLVLHQKYELSDTVPAWITDNRISRFMLSDIVGPITYKQYAKKTRFIESFGYYFHFYVGPE